MSAAAVPAAGDRAQPQQSHAGRERRVAASAQTMPLQYGFQGAPPTSLQSQPNPRLRYAPMQSRVSLLY